MHGCEVYTTVQIVIADLAGVRFARAPDAATGYKELNIGGGSRH